MIILGRYVKFCFQKQRKFFINKVLLVVSLRKFASTFINTEDYCHPIQHITQIQEKHCNNLNLYYCICILITQINRSILLNDTFHRRCDIINNNSY
jgi:hypothetical protein